MDRVRRRMQAALCTVLLLFAQVSPTAAATGNVAETVIEAKGQPGTSPTGSSNLDLRGTVQPLETVTLLVTVMTEQGTPITGARVALDEASNFGQADEHGRVWLEGLFPGHTYTVTVSHSGYRTKTFTYSYTFSPEDGIYPMDRMTVTLEREDGTPGGDTGNGDNSGGNNGGGGSNGGSTGGSGGGGSSGGFDGGSSGGTNGGTSGGTNGGFTEGTGGDSSGGTDEGAGNGSGNGSTDSNGGTTNGGLNGGNTGGTSGGSSGGSGGNTGSGTTGSSTPVSTVTGVDPMDKHPGLTVSLPTGTGELTIPESLLQDSLQTGQDIVVLDPTRPAGEQTVLIIPAFTQHDLDTLGTATFILRRGKDGSYELVITVPTEDTDRSSAGVPHNITKAVVEAGAYLLLEFEDDHTLDLKIGPEELKKLGVEQGDLWAEYDRTAWEGYLVYEVQNTYHGLSKGLTVPAEAFALAQQAGLGLKYRIYDSTTGEELWYEWIFSPANLAAGEAMDADLFIWAAPEGDDPILHLTKGVWCQYIIINHDGALPARAQLRVKNLEDFPVDQEMTLVVVNGNRLDTVATSLQPDETGWYSWYMDHCSSYALFASVQLLQVIGREYSPLRVDKIGDWDLRFIGKIMLACVLILLLLLLILLLLLKRREDEEDEELEEEKSSPEETGPENVTTETSQEVIPDHGRNKTR